MAYSDFTLAKAKATLALQLDETRNLFSGIDRVKPSERLDRDLQENIPLATAIATEKARSEFLIAPILMEVRRQTNHQISLFSGTDFNVEPSQGLTGFCDFILSRSPEQFFISAPVVIVIEAKNENIVAGLGQCLATMVAAHLFNQRSDNAIPVVLGAVTSGTAWRFLTLEQTRASIDSIEYHISQVDKILGILLQPFDKRVLALS
ncbi:MAG: hypothetical protein KME18_00455 [Phormidium tanganyikae FI6-MK23]|jgi:hypothetical protein|nr:hypothetical protein [Phormidium tanganyikae FI6-MK23]